MGANAEVIVIGMRCVLQDAGLLDYPGNYYKGPPEAIVTGHVGPAPTTDSSHDLAQACGVNLYDIEDHEVTYARVALGHASVFADDWIATGRERLLIALSDPDVRAWFLPNY